MAAWEGPQLLLAKVKNASGRIGIFYFRYIRYVDKSSGIVLNMMCRVSGGENF